jgi:SAM-dependent methyltransferase
MTEGSGYWQGAQEDATMQDEHRFIWDAILRTIDVDLSGMKVLDVGCNRGGFLRLLADTSGIAQGWGYDKASEAVVDATSLAGERPLEYAVADTVPEGWTDFDAAFSHEVIYLIDDLKAHADSIFEALLPGGVYFAVEGVHSASPMTAAWHNETAMTLRLPPLRDLDEVVATFDARGFAVSAARLQLGFVPATGHKENYFQWFSYYHDSKPLFRFERPSRSDASKRRV